jgi:hypothetical protein
MPEMPETKTLWQRVQDDEFKSKIPYSKENREKWKEDERRLRDEFKKAALDETCLAGHPKAQKAWEMAWDRGHASGYCEVLSELEELANLLLND